jgi:hypothetical protein
MSRILINPYYVIPSWDGIARDELPLAASILSFVYVPPGVPPDGSQLDELPMAPSIHAFTYTT